MSARIRLVCDSAGDEAPRHVTIDSFRPEGRLDVEARRLLVRVRALEGLVRAKEGQVRAMRSLLPRRGRP